MVRAYKHVVLPTIIKGVKLANSFVMVFVYKTSVIYIYVSQT